MVRSIVPLTVTWAKENEDRPAATMGRQMDRRMGIPWGAEENEINKIVAQTARPRGSPSISSPASLPHVGSSVCE